jgi:prepilin-type N-terminal cleavage/methylation domain-containing protein
MRLKGKSESILSRQKRVLAADSPFTAKGFSLVELVLVIAILAIVASIVIVSFNDIGDRARYTAAKASMRALREAWVGNGMSAGYIADMKYTLGFTFTNLRMHYLFEPPINHPAVMFNPETGLGWRGPYLNVGELTSIGSNETMITIGSISYKVSDYSDSFTVADPWGGPFILQIPEAGEFTKSVSDAKCFRYARLVSAGPNREFETPNDRLAGMEANGVIEARGDDLVLFLNRADIYEEEEP